MPQWSIPPEVHGGGRFVLRRRDRTPAYLKTYETGRLQDRVDEALSHLGPSCRACPRLCRGVDRLADTREIVGWLAALSRDTYLNLMDQYFPAWKAKTTPRFADINRRVSRPEMLQAAELARRAGLWRLDGRWREVSPWPALAATVDG